MTDPATAERPVGVAAAARVRLAGFVVAVALLAVTIVISIGVGARDIAPATIWAAITSFDVANDEHVMIQELRLPRTVVGLIVGPALGVCGALIQAYTRNPLADPGILGVNAGATFGVAFATGLLGFTAPLAYVWFALAGAAVITLVVYVLGSLGGSGATPVKLTMAGVALSAVLGGMTSAIILSNRATFDDMRFWGVGAIGGRSLDVVLSFAPLIIAGIVLAVVVARPPQRARPR